MADALQKLADEGDADAQCRLAVMFELGLDRELDYEMAYTYWEKAADQGSEWAIKRIGELCEQELVKEAKERLLKLKVATKDENPPSDEQGTLADPGKPKVLVVEDEEALRFFLVTLLEGKGYNVIEAENGKVAMAKLGEHPNISLIFTDLKMPKMNGMQFLQGMRALQACEGVPVIVMTAHTTPELVKKAGELKISGWIMKPFDSAKIIETIETHLGLKASA